MSGISRSNIPLAYSNLMIHSFFNTEEGEEVLQQYKQLFKIKTSNRAFEQDVIFSGFAAAPEKGESADYNYDTSTQGTVTTYRMYTYANGFQVSQEAKEDGEGKNLISKMNPLLKRSFYTTINQIAASVFNEGFGTNTINPTGDGVPLFSASHPTRSGNQSNLLTTPAALSYTALKSMITQIMNAKSDRDNPVELKARKLAIHVNNWDVATTIMRTNGAPGVANNDTNAILAYGGLLDEGFCANRYFTDPSAWFVLTDATDGLTLFERIPIQIEEIDGKYSSAGDIQVRGRWRGAANCSNFRGVYGTPGQ